MKISNGGSKAPEQKPKFRIPNNTDETDIENPSPHVTFNKEAADEFSVSAQKRMLNSSHNSGHNSEEDIDSVNSVTRARRKSNALIMTLIIFLGMATGSAFLAIGITSSKKEEKEQFMRQASDLVSRIERSWADYVTAAAYIHGRCRNRNFTRSDFRDTYEYLIGSNLTFQAAQFDPNITRDERPYYEEEARKYYAENYEYINYTGFMGFNQANLSKPEPRDEADFYFPIHYMEPIPGNEKAIDLDYHASGPRKQTVTFCMEHGKPGLTDRLTLVQEFDEKFGVVLFHPGFNLSTHNDVWPRDLASIVIRIPDLLKRAARDVDITASVYIYDNSDSQGFPRFLGAAFIDAKKEDAEGYPAMIDLNETHLYQLEQTIEENHVLNKTAIVNAANKNWTIVVHTMEGDYKPTLVIEIIGGVIIFAASVCLAYWVYANSKRMDAFNRMRSQAEAERAALILENARQATKAERELNDFIAHEVRNPVAAAMSACSFVKAAVNESEPLLTEEARFETREDVDIIDNALRFVNDLLRNMLDMHRAANKQLKVNMTPTDLLHDVLEPVQAMLPQRDSKFKVLVECPHGLVVMTDRLRLKQVCLNLGRNSVKFVDEGFIRLKAEVINNEVYIYIEDSGPGIPIEKRSMLFSKFQESLDSLSQGTGIGLFLCQNLVHLMEGKIYLDENYDSGVKGYPGTRFVVNLRREPIDPQFIQDYHSSSAGGTGETFPIESDGEEDSAGHELPESLSVLFVDDDPILRKLFTRTVRTVAPGWRIREASNGETALRLVEEDTFDLIFIDMYMASVEKQLLGTEAVRELRNRGVQCRICGLSANDKESEFLDAGANVFTFKPFPCEARALTQELTRVLFKDGQAD